MYDTNICASAEHFLNFSKILNMNKYFKCYTYIFNSFLIEYNKNYYKY